MAIDIIQEFEDGLNRTGMSKKELAMAVHVTQSAVSRWIERRSIPEMTLADLIHAVPDSYFQAAATEVLTGVDVFPDELHSTDPLTVYMAMSGALVRMERATAEMQEAMGKAPERRSKADWRHIENYTTIGRSVITYMNVFFGLLEDQGRRKDGRSSQD